MANMTKMMADMKVMFSNIKITNNHETTSECDEFEEYPLNNLTEVVKLNDALKINRNDFKQKFVSTYIF